MTESKNLKAALYYARRLGWPVLPIWPVRDGVCACGEDCGRNAGKHPISHIGEHTIIEHGVDDATTDPQLIRFWWGLVPDANIGCRGDKWFALDVDDMDALFEIESGFGQLPDTPRSFSGSGGTHIFFKQQRPPLGNRKGKLPADIDVRGNHGYCILPPSKNMNGEYVWEVSSKPNEVPLADPPEWLLELIGANVGAESVQFGDECKAPNIKSLGLPKVIERYIIEPPTPDQDRSRTDQRAIVALIANNLSDSEIRAVFNSYPIGTMGKYTEKGPHGDNYLAQSIASARAWLATHAASEAIPGKIITQAEAAMEREILREMYSKGWHDALATQPELVSMWPTYLGFDNPGMASTMVTLYSLGFRKDYCADDTSEEYNALVVPLVDRDGNIQNLDYSVYKPPDGINSRQWQTDSAPVFLADADNFDGDTLLILDDWDTAAYVYLKMGVDIPKNVIIASLSDELDYTKMSALQLSPITSLAKDVDRIIVIRHLSKRNEVSWLSHWLGRDKTHWIGWPFAPREMFKSYGMNTSQFVRALRGAVPIA